MNVSQYGRIIEEISMDQVHLEKTTWDAIDDIFDPNLYDLLIERESNEKSVFQAELKRFVREDL